MRNRKASTLAVRALPLLIAAAYVGSAVAEENKLEEIIITAQKRAERLQDVPISISAISGSQLETRGIENLANLNSLAPNLSFRPAGASNLISVVSIRGTSSGQPAIWMDPPVAMYLDGVYIGKAQGSIFDVVDVERIEVLRGPQGTLFGRNTQGGAVSFISRKPSGEFSGNVGFEIGNYGHTVLRGSVDLPRMGALSLSFGYRKENQDPWMKNNTPGVEGLSKKDKEAYRLAASLEVSPNTKIDYKYDHSDANDTPPAGSIVSLRGFAGSSPALNAILGPYLVNGRPTSMSTSNNPLYERARTEGHALTVSHQLNPNNELKYIYSTRKMQYDDEIDVDGTPSPNAAIHTSRNTDFKADSHEFQWVGNTDRLNYVLGLYAYEDVGIARNRQDQSLFGVPMQRVDFDTKTDAKAWFGQLDYKITDALTATAGLRHTTETKYGWSHIYRTTGFGGPAVVGGDVLPAGSASASWSANTPVFALAYKLNEHTNLYGRVARGFKSGGFSLESTTAVGARTPFNPEKSVTAEIGIKTSFLDNKAQLSAAIFQNKITDFHVSQVVPNTTSNFTVNAGKLDVSGLELEGAVLLAEGWKLQASYGYLDSKYAEFIDNARNIAGRPLIDTASNRVPAYAPKHTLNFTLDGRLAKTQWGTLRGIVDYSYTSEYYHVSANKDLNAPNAGGSGWTELDKLPAIININARLLLAGIPVGGPGAAEISLWVKNLTDQKQKRAQTDLGTFLIANWSEPRMYGLSFNYKW